MDKKRIGGEDGLVRDILHRQCGRVRDGAADDPEANRIKPGVGLYGEIGKQQDGLDDLEEVGFVVGGIT